MKNLIQICLLIILLFCSCSKKELRISNPVDKVIIYAMPKHIEFDSRFDSFKCMRREYRDTVITDSIFIQPFVNGINNLRKDRKRKSLDMRCVAIVAMNNGDSLYIAFGESFGTVILDDIDKDISLYECVNQSGRSVKQMNGFPMKDDSVLFNIIDEYVYAPHSNDYWRVKDNGIAWWLR